MIVVSNTSPLTNLAAIGQFELLHRLYGKVHIANSVWDELNAADKHWPGRNEVATADWIEQHPVQNETLVVALRRDLGKGEAETIALALELNADLVLLDEREGRHAVGILLEAKHSSLIDAIRPYLDALRQNAGFYLSETLYQHALALAGEN